MGEKPHFLGEAGCFFGLGLARRVISDEITKTGGARTKYSFSSTVLLQCGRGHG